MRNFLLAVFFSLVSFSILIAQKDLSPRWNITLTSTLGQSYSYNAPVRFVICIEGCPIKEQNPGLFQSYNLNLARRLGKSHHAGIGIGYTIYSFPTTYFQPLGGSGTFKLDRELKFMTYSLSYSWYFLQKEKIALLISPSLLAEQYIEREYVPYPPALPFAAALSIGMEGDFFSFLNYKIGLMYRSSLTPYNDEVCFSKHMPFAYGLLMGLSYIW